MRRWAVDNRGFATLGRVPGYLCNYKVKNKVSIKKAFTERLNLDVSRFTLVRNGSTVQGRCLVRPGDMIIALAPIPRNCRIRRKRAMSAAAAKCPTCGHLKNQTEPGEEEEL